MREFAQMRMLDIWYARLDVDDLARRLAAQATPKQLKRLDRNLAKTRAKTSLRVFDRLTQVVDGEPRIVSDPPLIVPIGELLPAGESATFEDAIRARRAARHRNATAGAAHRRLRGGSGHRHDGRRRAATSPRLASSLGIRLVLTRATGPVLDFLRRDGVVEVLGEENVISSGVDAVALPVGV
jgi:hypothetical protein